MRTLLSQFCEDFDGAVRPLLAPLRGATEALSETDRPVAAARILPELRDLGHQLETLVEKVAEQQAYVLIFGPLKSGKSTLMNAVSGAYVSEVTSLPAYPCMVFVSHANNRRFALSQYSGRTESFSDPAAMRIQVNRAHTELAKRIREVEAKNEDFDPAVHFPEALRRVDVKLPANDLQESGAVLVDTPGLYSRMKFGYDRMTKEFRNTAACAIFVVKSDNLFLEQVFEEFQALLELFSRIFLVVNLDTTKKDLAPDGSLVPSLEREDPIRIIEAFENLAMSAPLKAATDEGRLKIYPVDLLRAASKRLSPERETNGTPEPHAPDGQSDFEAFIGDLTEYLNSTDYLVAFLGDSLRYAGSVIGEIRGLCEHEGVKDLEQRVEELRSDHARTEHLEQVLERLQVFEWQESIDRFQESVVEGASEEMDQIRSKLHHALKGALESWFTSDASLEQLIKDDLVPLHDSSRREITQSLHQSLSKSIQADMAGIEIPTPTRSDLQAAGIVLEDLSRKALGKVDLEPACQVEPPPIASHQIPVRKGFWDWLLFRSKARVNKSLFGPVNKPDKRVSKQIKGRRLGSAARQMMWNTIEEHLDEVMSKRVRLMSRFIVGDYAENLKTNIACAIEDRQKENGERLAELRTALEREGRILESVRELDAALQQGQQGVEQLSDRYGATEPDLLIQPAPRPEEIPQPQTKTAPVDTPAPAPKLHD